MNQHIEAEAMILTTRESWARPAKSTTGAPGGGGGGGGDDDDDDGGGGESDEGLGGNVVAVSIMVIGDYVW